MPATESTGGRPSDYTDDLADKICDLIAEGQSLRAICSASDDLPNERTVYRWLKANTEFRQQYARAREEQAELYADEIIEIADQYSTASDIASPDTVQRARVRIDARKWKASKLAPKKYGDKIAHVGGGKDDEPIKINRSINVDDLSKEELEIIAGIKVNAG